jgi:predicted nucleotidyltransferase
MLSILTLLTELNLNHIEKVKQFNIPKTDIVFCGSALLVVKNLIPSNRDLDVCVSNKIYNELIKRNDVSKSENSIYKTQDNMFEFSNKIEMFNMSFDELKNHTVKISGWMFMSPQLLLKFYEKLNRPKDQDKIKIIKDNFGV